MKTIKIWLAAAILLLMVGTTAADPGIVMEVTPIDNEILPGETATYEVNVSYFMLWPPGEHVALSIDNPISDWTYTFDPTEFDINTGVSKYSMLSISVPSDAPPGTYEHTVNATATAVPFIIERVTTTIETTVIPEFTTIAIPVAATLGLLLLIRRRKQK